MDSLNVDLEEDRSRTNTKIRTRTRTSSEKSLLPLLLRMQRQSNQRKNRRRLPVPHRMSTVLLPRMGQDKLLRLDPGINITDLLLVQTFNNNNNNNNRTLSLPRPLLPQTRHRQNRLRSPSLGTP